MDNGWEDDGALVRESQALRADDDDFVQAGILVREVFSEAERDGFVETVAGALDGIQEPVPSTKTRAASYQGGPTEGQ